MTNSRVKSETIRASEDKQKILELYTAAAFSENAQWKPIVQQQHCKYIGKRCAKRRKTEPDVSIGTCSVQYGKKSLKDIIICPFRFLERQQIFTDCIHLLTHREPGDELHVVSEVAIPGGSVDYCLIAMRKGKVVDFVGIELQAVDTTGTVWPTRQRFLSSLGLAEEMTEDAGFGMNWKMSAKTILVQLHHKVETFEHVGRHFVLVLQDHFLNEMVKGFSFGHIGEPKLGHSMHFHAYSLVQTDRDYRLELASRRSTDSQGVQTSLGNAVEAKVELEIILSLLQDKISKATTPTLLSMQTATLAGVTENPPLPEILDKAGMLTE